MVDLVNQYSDDTESIENEGRYENVEIINLVPEFSDGY